MRVRPEEFKVGEKVLYFSPRKYQGHQDKWLRKFSGPFEIIKLLVPVNVVLRKSAKSTPFTAHLDKIRKLPIDQTDPNDMSERAQEQEGNKMDMRAIVDNSPAAGSKLSQSPENIDERRQTVEIETQNSYRLPDSSGFFPGEEFEGGNAENRRPQRDHRRPLRYRQ